MSAVFMGTPDVAVPCLEATVAWAGGAVRVVTQPDRPRGRSSQPQPSPVKRRADELGLEVVQPDLIRGNRSFLTWLEREPVEVGVVVAYGHILPREVLYSPRLGCVNVHFSLLPKYRGAAPVQWALIRGETETGITTMLMDEGLDSGPILLQERVAIAPDETAGELLARLAAMAPRILSATLEELPALRGRATDQDREAATTAPRLSKDHGIIDWSQPAEAIVALIRGVTPWPGATADLAGEAVRICRATVGAGAGRPGALLAVEAGGLLVAAGSGAVWLEEVQAPGRRPMGGEAYARGKRLEVEGGGRDEKES